MCQACKDTLFLLVSIYFCSGTLSLIHSQLLLKFCAKKTEESMSYTRIIIFFLLLEINGDISLDGTAFYALLALSQPHR